MTIHAPSSTSSRLSARFVIGGVAVAAVAIVIGAAIVRSNDGDGGSSADTAVVAPAIAVNDDALRRAEAQLPGILDEQPPAGPQVVKSTEDSIRLAEAALARVGPALP